MSRQTTVICDVCGQPINEKVEEFVQYQTIALNPRDDGDCAIRLFHADDAHKECMAKLVNAVRDTITNELAKARSY